MSGMLAEKVSIRNENSPVAEIRIYQDPQGNRDAKIIFRDNIPEGRLAQLPQYLHDQGLRFPYPDVVEGQNALVVRKYGDVNGVINILSKAGLIDGNIEIEKFDNEEKGLGVGQKIWRSITNNSAIIAGRVGLFGHIATTAYAVVGEKKNISALIGGSLGITLASIRSIWGIGDRSLRADNITDDFQDYLSRMGYDIEKNEKLDATGFESFYNFVDRNTIPIDRALGSYASVNNLFGGLGYIKNGDIATGLTNIYQNSTNLIGNSIIVFVDERKEHEKVDPNPLKLGAKIASDPIHTFKHIGDYVQSHPFISNALLNSTDNFSLFLNAGGVAHQYYKQNGKGGAIGVEQVVLKAVQAVSWGLATAIEGLASKNQKNIEGVDPLEETYAYAARMIVDSPPEVRAEVISHAGFFLSGQKDIYRLRTPEGEFYSPEYISAKIEAKVQKMEHSPFLVQVSGYEAQKPIQTQSIA